MSSIIMSYVKLGARVIWYRIRFSFEMTYYRDEHGVKVVRKG